jgi:UDP-N-acetylglucosamine--N-acetylmuramyl-(pentapeptide) pyrophosphoryl-undecaprenol N-acetylglucosamine transferase
MSVKRILITAGGTGGHLYPAQALAQQLIKQPVVSDVLFVAGGLGKNRYFDAHRFPFREIACSPLLSRNPLKCFQGARHLFKGILQSLQILKNYQPHLVVGFGSYYTVPILIAARWLKIPIILHEANSIPGRANQWLAPLATFVGIHFPSTASFFKNKAIEVGLPLREGYALNALSQKEALAYYGLSADRRTLLICGGSQGARAINQLVAECLPTFQRLGLQMIHLTGDAEKAKELMNLYAAYHIPACVKAFENQMQMAWRGADGFVGRSGASTIAESLEFEVPGILIPYPYATDQHQEKNADFLVEMVHSGRKLLESELAPNQLGKAIEELFETQQYSVFKEALRIYKQRPHQLTLCELILRLSVSHKDKLYGR